NHAALASRRIRALALPPWPDIASGGGREFATRHLGRAGAEALFGSLSRGWPPRLAGVLCEAAGRTDDRVSIPKLQAVSIVGATHRTDEARSQGDRGGRVSPP